MTTLYDFAAIAEELPTGMRRAITLTPVSRGKIVGTSESMRAALDIIRRVAASTCSVLVTGESGTGKEVLVAALHDASPRARGPFVVVSCGAIPDALIEAELFGPPSGAFAARHAARQGRIAAAEGGTLLLDEIAELPLAMQVRLLRVLQGCDVRVVAATNRDLEAEVAAGRFREDLFCCLNVVHVHLPALRERREDIRALAAHFLKDAVSRLGRRVEGFTEDALRALESYSWPGNIRALENAIERAVLFATHPLIEMDDLPPRVFHAMQRRGGVQVIAPYGVGPFDVVRQEETQDAAAGSTPNEDLQSAVMPCAAAAPEGSMRLPDDGIDLRAAVEAFENDLIRQALERTKWNKQHAARLLGINRTTLVEMIKRKRLVDPRDAESAPKRETG